ncbi:MAG TPA: redoxin domain-containing protein [Gemmatales bacterium]|nr:redoxin domain-containing protein [Gemmatales bacterium]
MTLSHISLVLGLLFLQATLPEWDKSPLTGETAQDFELKTLDGSSVKLSLLYEKGPVAIIVLRGYPGAQSEICQKQVADLISKSSSFMDAGATVLLIYPGAAGKLDEHAREFLADKMLPNNFRLVTDPDYGFAAKYGLRWAAPNETVFPATFGVNTKGVVTFSLVSKGHGGRAKTEELLKALSKT